MGRNINMNALSNEARAMLSDVAISFRQTTRLNALYRDAIGTQKALRDDIITRRETARKANPALTANDLAVQFSTMEVDNEIRRLETERADAIKPYSELMKMATTFVPQELYASYIYAMTKGLNAVPKAGTYVSIGKSSIEVTKSFTGCIKSWVSAMGFGNVNDKSVEHFADIYRGWIAGMRPDTKSPENWLTIVNQRSFNKTAMLGLIKFGIEHGAWSLAGGDPKCDEAYKIVNRVYAKVKTTA